MLIDECHGLSLVVGLDRRVDRSGFAKALVVSPRTADSGGGMLGIAIPLGQILQIVGFEL